MRALRRLLNILIGLVFLFSSMLKLMDPTGTGLIVEGYFEFLHLDFLKPLAKVTGESLSLLEATVGVALVTGVWRRVFAVLAMVLLGFFTLISVLLVIFNPEMSCGCFGKAIELTHTQTLLKNLILCVLSVPAFIPIGRSGKPGRHRYAGFFIAEALIASFAVYSLVNLPVEDFTEFAASETIVEESQLEDMPGPILPVWDAVGEDRSSVLTCGRVAVVSVYEPGKLTFTQLARLASFIQDAYNAGWTPVVLSAGKVEIDGADIYFADYRKLLSLNRSNAGVTLLEDGYIIDKCCFRSIPSFDELYDMNGCDAATLYADAATGRSLVLQFLTILTLAALFLV